MSSLEAHKKAYKPRATVEEGRHKRQQENQAIRKQKREEHIAKRRQITVVEDEHKEEYSRIVAQFHMNLEAQCSALLSEDPKAQMESAVNLRKILSIDGAPPIPAPFARAIIPQLCYFLTRTDRPQLQFEAAWSLTNICAMNAEFTQDVVHTGAINSFLQILETSPHEDLRGQAVWALANIAGDTIEYRNMLLSMGTMPILLRHLERCTGALMMRNLTWAISNFCRGESPPDFTLVKDAIPQLSTLLYSSDIEVVVDATWALSHLADGDDDQIQAVLDAGACKRLIDLTMHSQLVVQVPAVRAVGNIISGSDLQTQICIANGVLPCLVSLFSSLKPTVRKEACWIVSNITAGNVGQKQAVIDANLVPLLIDSIFHAEFDIKKEALFALFNICSEGTPQQIDYLVLKRLLEAIAELLQLTDVTVLACALSTLEHTLRSGRQQALGLEHLNSYARRFEEIGGTTILNKLLDHPNERVYEPAMVLMEHYFDHIDAVRESISAADAVPAPYAGASTSSAASPFFSGGFASLGSPSTPTSSTLTSPGLTAFPTFAGSPSSPQAFNFNFALGAAAQQPQSPFMFPQQGGGGGGGFT